MLYPEIDHITQLVHDAERILIIQADNPDGDSLGSALALEQILGDLGKQTWLYCGVDMPAYLHYLAGWDRVSAELPSAFDLSIIVDASTMSLLEKLQSQSAHQWLATKPCLVLDHHEKVEQPVPYASLVLNDWHRSSTGELIYSIAVQAGWPLSTNAMRAIMTAILGDTQGLTNQLASADTYRIMADMTEAGTDRVALEESRREYSKMPQSVYVYKGTLLQRSEFSHAGAIVTVTIPQSEITAMSPLYNPGPLVQGDMLQTKNVRTAIVFKVYADGKITGAIRCNHGSGIAADLAAHMGGGGHAYASGFKITDGRPFTEVKQECIGYAAELLRTIDTTQQGMKNETVQHTYSTD